MFFDRLRRRALVGTAGICLALALPLGLTATAAGAATGTRSSASTAAKAGTKAAAKKKVSRTPHAIAHRMMRTRTYHWTSTHQWTCLKALWNRESGWHVHAGSYHGAYGIPQALPGTKMGRGARNSASAQIHWGLSYIKGRYGSPCRADSHQRASGWY